MAKLATENLISALPADLSAGLFSRARPVRLTAGQMLFAAGDMGNGCYRIDVGLLKVSAMWRSAGERILAILGPGSIVGELSEIDEAPRSATVTAIRDSELSFVSRRDFYAFADEHPQLYKHLMVLLARRLRDADRLVAASSFLSPKGRVARAMMSLAEAFGHDVGDGRIMLRQKLSQSDLAAMSGIARESVSRVLSEWRREKVVSRIAGYYCLENTGLLKRETRL
jgi:CRP/FNR family cyclic AMP-dependent transcriptional regulator